MRGKVHGVQLEPADKVRAKRVLAVERQREEDEKRRKGDWGSENENLNNQNSGRGQLSRGLIGLSADESQNL